MAEGLGVFYSFYISKIIEFIQDPDRCYTEGIMHTAIFFLANFFCVLLRQHWIQLGMFASLKLRRVLAAKMFAKVEKLSMRSLSETDSGKLVSVVSGDLS